MNGVAEAGELCLGSVVLTEPINPVQKIANGDFDGNDVLDLLTCEGNDAEAAAYFGAGDGTFPGYAGEAFSPENTDVAVGNFNNDTDLDIVLGLDSATENIGIILGDGAGTYPSQFPTYGNVTEAVAVAVGDLDGNGYDDVAAVGAVAPSAGFDGRLLVFLSAGNGTGSFGNPVENMLPDGTYFDVITGDWTGNTVVDVASVYSSTGVGSFIRACRGNNTGAFANNVCETFDAGAEPRALAAGDFNGDGDQDIAASQSGANAVLIFPGNGTGTFGSPTSVMTADISWGMAAGDLDNDGIDDIVATHPVPATASVILGGDLANVTVDATLDVGAAGYIPEDVTLGDFNDDGALDVALGMRGFVNSNPGIAVFVSDV